MTPSGLSTYPGSMDPGRSDPGDTQPWDLGLWTLDPWWSHVPSGTISFVALPRSCGPGESYACSVVHSPGPVAMRSQRWASPDPIGSGSGPRLHTLPHGSGGTPVSGIEVIPVPGSWPTPFWGGPEHSPLGSSYGESTAVEALPIALLQALQGLSGGPWNTTPQKVWSTPVRTVEGRYPGSGGSPGTS